jgi:hypothetical protein
MTTLHRAVYGAAIVLNAVAALFSLFTISIGGIFNLISMWSSPGGWMSFVYRPFPTLVALLWRWPTSGVKPEIPNV